MKIHLAKVPQRIAIDWNRSASWRARALGLLAAVVIMIASAGFVRGAQVAFYPFEGNANDQSGNGNNGSAIGGISYITGKVGLAAHFNNTSSYIYVSDSASLRPNQFTIAAWVKPASADGRILEKGNSNSYWLYLSGTGVPIFGFYDGTYHDLYAPTSLPLNTWSLVAGTYDGAALKLYINGALVSSLSLVSAPSQTSQPLFIGFKPNGSVVDYFDGLIDEVRIYNNALSASQIRDLYYGPTPVDGHIDLSFDAGKFTRGEVDQCIAQPDGKLLVAGYFGKVNGVTQPYIARFNSDGSTDTSFVVTGEIYNYPNMILQPDGKIILFGGDFYSINGVPRYRGIARLNPDSSLDGAFDPGRLINDGYVYSTALQTDGKIVVAGAFSSIDTGVGTSVPRSGVARFNKDGTFDPSYNPGSGFTNSLIGYAYVPYAVRESTNKVIIAGDFDGFDGHPVPGLVRLNTDGSFDNSFDPGTATSFSNIFGLFIQSDDQLIVFGRRSSFNGIAHYGIVRLNQNGAVDSGFSTAEFKEYAAAAWISSVAQATDGKLIVGGSFHSLGAVTANNVVRLQADGARDASFDSSNATGPCGHYVNALAVRPDNEVFVGGYFSSYGETGRDNIALATSSGSLDSAFNPASGLTDYSAEIRAVAPQPDGKILVGGAFTSVNGVPRCDLVRLNADGSIDSSFGVTKGANRSLRAIRLQDDGKILIAGGFTGVDGVSRGGIARLNADGSIDSSFDPGGGTTNAVGEFGLVYAVADDPAGNVYLGGDFSAVNGVPRTRLAKLTSAGTLDTAFDPGAGPNSTVLAIAPPAGSAGPVVGGQFTQYNGTSVGRIVRVDPVTGTRDSAFSTANGSGFNSIVYALATAADGKYVAAGSFTSFFAATRQRIARLNADGTLDSTFTQLLNFSGFRAVALKNQAIYAAGNSGPVRFYNDGAVDPSFDSGTGVSFVPPDPLGFIARINALGFQIDGRLLAGGIFNNYNGTTRYSLVRLAPAVVSRKIHGSAGAFDLPLPLTGTPGVECRSGGSTNDYEIVVTFANSVTVTGNPQSQVTSGSGQVGSGGIANGGTVTITGSMVAIPLTNVANAQTINVTLYGVNGSGNVIIPISVLVGDANGNGTVNASDVSQTKSRIGQAISATNFRSDVNGNGVINGSDISLIKSRVGTGLP